MSNFDQLTTVNMVNFGSLDSNQYAGVIRQVDNHTWRIKDGKNGKDTDEFQETGRTSDAIFLFDAVNNAGLQINLATNVILSVSANGDTTDLYSILVANEKPTGWLARRVHLGKNTGDLDYVFQQTGPKTWRERVVSSGDIYTYTETGRGDWGVFLKDNNRDLRIQFDLHRMVRLNSWSDAEFEDVDTIAHATAKVTGWLVNRVDYTTQGREVDGSFRQISKGRWIEDDLDQGYNLFEYKEVFRGPWAVELYDKSRALTYRIDLFTTKISISQHGNDYELKHRVAKAFSQPKLGLDNVDTLSSIVARLRDVGSTHRFHQSGQGTWIENYTNSSGDPESWEFQEKGRSAHAVHLYCPKRDVWFHLDILKREVSAAETSGTSHHFYDIISASFGMNGHTINHVVLTNTTKTVGSLRQTGETLWVEDNIERGPAIASYVQTERTDSSVFLEDKSRQLRIEISLAENKVFQLGKAGKKTLLYRIAQKLHGPEYWDKARQITSRSVLAEDYDLVPGKEPVSKPVFRSSISFSGEVEHVDVWASEEVTFEVRGQKHTVDPVRSVRLTPNALSKLSISIAAKGLSCPQLLLRTNLMRADERHTVMPDIEALYDILEISNISKRGL